MTILTKDASPRTGRACLQPDIFIPFFVIQPVIAICMKIKRHQGLALANRNFGDRFTNQKGIIGFHCLCRPRRGCALQLLNWHHWSTGRDDICSENDQRKYINTTTNHTSLLPTGATASPHTYFPPPNYELYSLCCKMPLCGVLDSTMLYNCLYTALYNFSP